MNAVRQVEAPQAGARRLFHRELAEGYQPTGMHRYAAIDGSGEFFRIRLKGPEGKVIKPIRLDGERYVFGEPKAPPEGKPLYRLEDVQRAPVEALVWVVEGEGCADALAALGLPATTSGSATSADGADWTPLRQRRVRIWPDNNEAGFSYGANVAKRLQALGCEVSVVDISGMELPDGGDVVDFLERYPSAADRECLEALPLEDISAPELEADEGMAPIERLTVQLTPFDAVELEAARQPHPHAFQRGECGIFPDGEVTVIAAPGREGKTFATIALATSYVLGLQVVGLTPQPDRSVYIFSSEDDRRQYARKVEAQRSRLGAADAETIRARIVVPDLQAEGMEAFQTLIDVEDRRPIESLAVDYIIEALRERMEDPCPPGILIFETASTLSEADEDNRSLKVLVRALRRIARALGVAVVIVHHTSQAAATNLPDLNVSTADVRGATALVFNSRQNFLLANLGSEEDPHPDTDARTVMRRLATPQAHGRVSVLVPLDSSKGIDPAPIFLSWHSTDYGAALSVTPVPHELEGMPWRRLRQRMQAMRADTRQAAKDDAQIAKIDQVANLVRNITAAGGKATARAVSMAAGKSPGWSAPHLMSAVSMGRLTSNREQVPRVRDPVDVYRPADSSGHPS